MKFILLLAVPYTAIAASWANLFKGLQLKSGKQAVELKASQKNVNGCIAHVAKFLNVDKPATKGRAIERAMDNCALSKKVDDKNYVCPRFRELLTDAFRREATDKDFTAVSFCNVAETYVAQLREGASRVPNMGKGSGFNFKLSKDCQPIVKASLAPAVTLPAHSAPDFWYALCMNQDCAHFLPSRTRWCTQNHQPTHSQTVCEATRLFVRDEVAVKGPGQLDPNDICNMYSEFVEDATINVDAYKHVVHGEKHETVPVPGDRKRALDSARMKHDAKKHGIRDASGKPVEPVNLLDVRSAAAKMPTGLFVGFLSLAGLSACSA